MTWRSSARSPPPATPARGALRPPGQPGQLRQGIEDNLATLGASRLAAVNLRMMDPSAAPDSRFDTLLAALVRAREEGLIDGIGLSNISRQQLLRAARPDGDRLRAEPLHLADQRSWTSSRNARHATSRSSPSARWAGPPSCASRSSRVPCSPRWPHGCARRRPGRPRLAARPRTEHPADPGNPHPRSSGRESRRRPCRSRRRRPRGAEAGLSRHVTTADGGPRFRGSPWCRCARRRTGVKNGGGAARDVVAFLVRLRPSDQPDAGSRSSQGPFIVASSTRVSFSARPRFPGRHLLAG